MNEEEIVAKAEAKAKANAPEAIAEVEPNVVKIDTVDLGTKLDLFRELDIDMNHINDEDINDKLKDITDWAKIKSPNMNLRDIVFMIQEVQFKVGRAGNKTALDNVWEYSRLDFELMKIDGKIKLMENQNG